MVRNAKTKRLDLTDHARAGPGDPGFAVVILVYVHLAARVAHHKLVELRTHKDAVSQTLTGKSQNTF